MNLRENVVSLDRQSSIPKNFDYVKLIEYGWSFTTKNLALNKTAMHALIKLNFHWRISKQSLSRFPDFLPDVSPLSIHLRSLSAIHVKIKPNKLNLRQTEMFYLKSIKGGPAVGISRNRFSKLDTFENR